MKKGKVLININKLKERTAKLGVIFTTFLIISLFIVFYFTRAEENNNFNFQAVPISACAVEISWNAGSDNYEFTFAPGGLSGNNIRKVVVKSKDLNKDLNGKVKIIDNNDITVPLIDLVRGKVDYDKGPGFLPESNFTYGLIVRKKDGTEIYGGELKGGKTPKLAVSNITVSTTGLSAFIDSSGKVSIKVPVPKELKNKKLGLYGIIIENIKNGYQERIVATSSDFIYFTTTTDNIATTTVYRFKYYYTDEYCHPFEDATKNGKSVNIVRKEQVFMSEEITINIPAAPYDGKIDKVNMDSSGSAQIYLSWKNRDDNNRNIIKIERVREEERSTFYESGSSTSWVDKIATWASTYSYKIISCNGENICSAPFVLSTTTPQVIGFFGHRLKYVNIPSSTAEVILGYSSYFIDEVSVYIYRKKILADGKVDTTKQIEKTCSIQRVCYIDDDVALGQKYIYYLEYEKKSPSTGSGIPIEIFGSTSTELDLTAISPVYGWAWAGVSSTPISNSHSVGWIKFSSDTTSTDPNAITSGTQNYGVYLNRNTNELMGYAWSGIPCSQGSKEVCGYGWISFNKADLDMVHYSSSAKLLEGGNLSGYIKFLSFNSSQSSFDGYVNLSGIKYTSSTGVLSGSTNEVSVVPKIYFCDPKNPDNPIYCVYVSSTTYPAQTPKAKIEKPRNVTARPNPCSNGSCSITVSWTNPQDYSEVMIMMFNVDEANDPKASNSFNRCKTESDVTRCWREKGNFSFNSPNEYNKRMVLTGDHNYQIDGLVPGTKYYILIRAILRQ